MYGFLSSVPFSNRLELSDISISPPAVAVSRGIKRARLISAEVISRGTACLEFLSRRSVRINERETQRRCVSSLSRPSRAPPLNLVVGNTSANLRFRGTQDRYSSSAEILRVSRIPIGRSQLSDKPVSRLPLLTDLRAGGLRHREIFISSPGMPKPTRASSTAIAYYCFINEFLLLLALPAFILTELPDYLIFWSKT